MIAGKRNAQPYNNKDALELYMLNTVSAIELCPVQLIISKLNDIFKRIQFLGLRVLKISAQ